MPHVPKTCIECGIVTQGTRCPRCTKAYDIRRNALPHRQAYLDPRYRSMVPTGMCYWCKTRVATTRDHKVRLIDGGTNDPSNIVFACGPCNFGRGNNQERTR